MIDPAEVNCLTQIMCMQHLFAGRSALSFYQKFLFSAKLGCLCMFVLA